MKIQELYKLLDDDSRRPIVIYTKKAVAYLLHKKGYSNSHIAMAMGVRTSRIYWMIDEAQKDVDYKNETILRILDNLSGITLILKPYYETVIANLKDIRIYLYANNNKFIKTQRKWKRR